MRSINTRYLIAFQPFIVPLLLIPLKISKIELQIYVQNIEYERFRSLGKFWWLILYLIEYIAYRNAKILYFISDRDLKHAIKTFGLNVRKCYVVPYGTHLKQPPKDSSMARKSIQDRHNIQPDEFLIIFFGLLSYKPNQEAVDRIIRDIDPLLSTMAEFEYRFIICGQGLPESYQELSAFPNIDYYGFVEDIDEYIQAADVMINPVTSGGGVKTKVLKAIALNTMVASSRSGAVGIETGVCGSQLIEIDDHNIQEFCNVLIRIQATRKSITPGIFYKTYHWNLCVDPIIDNTGDDHMS
jgi:glycosyltransferase involved in cell wall biosynthesis